jgi:Ni/Co efflux regulator RcnB
MKKLLTLLFTAALAFSLSAVSFAQDAGSAPKDDTKKEEKAEKKAAKKKAKKEKKAEKKAEEKKDDTAK